jgi:protein-tyrosine phosphatase
MGTGPDPARRREKMNLFNRRTRILSDGFLSGFCDCHCHILPGVDDGMKTPEKSLAALNFYASHGVAGVTFTPHVMEGLHNTRESLLKVFDDFREGYALGIESNVVQIRLGAEYMLDSGFPKHLDEGLLQIFDGIALVETSYFMAPMNMEEMLYDVDSGDLVPAIAHPERYIYMEMRDYERLKEKGYYLQLNILSLTGAYGPEAQAKAGTLLKKGMYDFVGTDLHHLGPFRERLEMLKVDKGQREALERMKENNTEKFQNK